LQHEKCVYGISLKTYSHVVPDSAQISMCTETDRDMQIDTRHGVGPN